MDARLVEQCAGEEEKRPGRALARGWRGGCRQRDRCWCVLEQGEAAAGWPAVAAATRYGAWHLAADGGGWLEVEEEEEEEEEEGEEGREKEMGRRIVGHERGEWMG
jgi:hypothetical protein